MIKTIKILKKAFNLLHKKLKIYFILALIIGIILIIIEYFIPLFQNYFIDNSLKIKTIYFKYLYILLFLYFLFITLESLENYFNILSEDNGIYYNTKKFYTKLFFFDRKKLLSKGIGYYRSIAAMESENLMHFFKSYTFIFIFMLIQSIFIFRIIYLWNKIISIVIIASVLIIDINILLYYKFRNKIYKKLREKESILSFKIIEALKTNFSLKLNCFDFYYKKQIFKNSDNLFKDKYKYGKIEVFFQTLNNIIKYITFVFILIYLINQIIKSNFSYGKLVAIISYFMIIYRPIDYIFYFIGSLSTLSTSYNKLFEIINNTYKQVEEKIILEDKINSLNFNNVSIFYKIEDKNNKDNNKDNNKNNNKNTSEKNNIKYVIKDFNLEIKDSKKIAIVGLSGEGKTSILKVLYKQSNNYENEIIINKNIDLKLIPLLNYYYHINVFSQETEILNRTLKENLIFNKTLIKLNDSDKIKREIKEKVQKVIIKLKNIITNNKSIGQIDFDQYKDVLLENREIIKSGKNIIDNKIIKKTINLIKKIVKQDEDIENYFLSTGFISDKIESNNIYLFYYFKKLLFENRLEKMIEDYIFNLKYVFEEDYEEVIKRLELKKLEGREFGEDGAFISGGERQRIVFGRFLLKKNYDLFVFDEPFTSLDILAEEKLLQIAKEKLKNKMGIIISHKLNILKELADEFIVIDKGKVVDRGTHNDLINKEGLYKKLFDKFSKQRKVIEK